jgi:predicted hydrocarbon binding protein
MHGVVFQSFGSFLAAAHGPARAAAVLGDRSYSPDETYADEELSYLLGRAAGATGLEIDELYREFGSYTAQTTFLAMFPDYYASHSTARTFLLGIEQEIHRVVRRTVPGAHPPHLRVVPLGSVGVVVTYTSDRRLCRLLEGLVAGTAEHYGEHANMVEAQCMRRGDPACAFNVELERAGAR